MALFQLAYPSPTGTPIKIVEYDGSPTQCSMAWWAQLQMLKHVEKSLNQSMISINYSSHMLIFLFSSEGGRESLTLKEVSVSIMTTAQCRQFYGSRINNNLHVCTAGGSLCRVSNKKPILKKVMLGIITRFL